MWKVEFDIGTLNKTPYFYKKYKPMLEQFSTDMQFIIVIIAIAILFFLVLFNNKRNRQKRYDRKNRNFRRNFYEKKKNKDED